MHVKPFIYNASLMLCMHACMAIASGNDRLAYCLESAWLDIVFRMSEMVLTRSGHALGCRGGAARGGVFFLVHMLL